MDWESADHYTTSRMIILLPLLMLAVTAGAFLVVTWIATRGLFFLVQESPG